MGPMIFPEDVSHLKFDIISEILGIRTRIFRTEKNGRFLVGHGGQDGVLPKPWRQGVNYRDPRGGKMG